MDISFNCDKCGQHIVIDAAGAGSTVQCPKCQAELVVPQPPSTFRCKCGHHIVIDEAGTGIPIRCPKCHRILPVRRKQSRQQVNAAHNKTQVALAKACAGAVAQGSTMFGFGVGAQSKKPATRRQVENPNRNPSGKLRRGVVDKVTSRTILRNPLCNTEPVKFLVDGVEVTCDPPSLRDLYALRDKRSVQLWTGEPHCAWEQLSSEDIQRLVSAYERAWIL
jgi:DNA-directed RNA polymerase subunit M/transcription elongation factor TFIIS